MAANGISDPLTSILSAIESVREELVGLRADLTIPSASVNAPVVAAAAGQGMMRQPTDWRLFAERVRSVLASAGYSGSALGTEVIQFASSLKEEESDLSAWSDEEILARRAAWSPSGVSSGMAKKERKNPWASLTSTQMAARIAKMKEGKAAKTAAGESAPAVQVAAPAPLPAPPAQAPRTFKPVLLQGVRYLVNMNSGHAYHREENGSQGNWAGLFKREPKPYVNTSVPKPLEGGKQKSTRKHKRRHSKRTRKH
jgi:hypothetical protein